LSLEQGLQVAAQRLADQAGRIGVLDQARGQRLGTGNADTDRAAPAQLIFGAFHQRGDG
jgi:hypothetical protein